MPKYTERQNGTLEPLQLASAFTNRSQNWRSKNNLKSLKKGKPKKEPNGKPDGTKRKRKHGDNEQDGDRENQEHTSKKQRANPTNQQAGVDEHQPPAPTLKRKNPYDQQEGDDEYQDPAPKRQRGALDAQQPRPRLTPSSRAPVGLNLAQIVPDAVQENLTAVADPSFAVGSLHGNGGSLSQGHQFAQGTYGHALYEARDNSDNFALLHEDVFAQFAPAAPGNALHAADANHGNGQYPLGGASNGINYSPMNPQNNEYPSPSRTHQGVQPYTVQRPSMGQARNELLQTPQGSNQVVNLHSYQRPAFEQTQNDHHQPTANYSEYVQPPSYQNPYTANSPLAGTNVPSAYGYVQDHTAQPLTPSNPALGSQSRQMNGQEYPINQLNIYDAPTPSTHSLQLNGYQPVGSTQVFTPSESPSVRSFSYPNNQGYPNPEIAPPQSSQQANAEQSVVPSADVSTVNDQEPDDLTVRDLASTGPDSEAAQDEWIQAFVADRPAHHQTFEENLAELLSRANREHNDSINAAANQEGQDLSKISEVSEEEQQQFLLDSGNDHVPSPEVGADHNSEALEEPQQQSSANGGDESGPSLDGGLNHVSKASGEHQPESALDDGNNDVFSPEAGTCHASKAPYDLQNGSQNAEGAQTRLFEEPVAIDITDWDPEQIDYRYLQPTHENQQGELDELLEDTLEAFGAYHGADNVPFVGAMSYLDAIRVLRSENTQFFIDRDAPIQPLPYRGPWFGELGLWRLADHVRG